MIVDGKTLARELEGKVHADIAALGRPLSVALFVMSDDLATRKFIEIKKKVAERLGIAVHHIDVPKATTTAELVALVAQTDADGIVVQLPLAPAIDTASVLAAIPRGKDLDAISPESERALAAGDTTVLPPVVGALAAILESAHVDSSGKQVAVIGSGKLVGAPAALWFRQQGARVSVADATTPDISSVTKNADIIVLGAGQPGLLTPGIMKEGAVVLDAGTSEASGKLAGDADPSCAEKASLFTPVPGGIGPLTVVTIFKNLLALASKA